MRIFNRLVALLHSWDIFRKKSKSETPSKIWGPEYRVVFCHGLMPHCPTCMVDLRALNEIARPACHLVRLR